MVQPHAVSVSDANAGQLFQYNCISKEHGVKENKMSSGLHLLNSSDISGAELHLPLLGDVLSLRALPASSL